MLTGTALALLSQHTTSVVTSGTFVGSTVAGNWTLVDIRAIRDGSKDGAGLFAAVEASMGMARRLPGDLRLWPEFSDPAAPATDCEYFRLGVMRCKPLRASEIDSIGADPQRDRRMAAMVLAAMDEPEEGKGIDPPSGRGGPRPSSPVLALPRRVVPAGTAVLKLTADTESTIGNGRHDRWQLGRTLLEVSEVHYIRDPYFGPPDPLAPTMVLPAARLSWPTLILHRAGSAPGAASYVLLVDIPAALIVLGALVVVWIACWAALGGWHARRQRRRARRGQCLACGHLLGPPDAASVSR